MASHTTITATAAWADIIAPAWTIPSRAHRTSTGTVVKLDIDPELQSANHHQPCAWQSLLPARWKPSHGAQPKLLASGCKALLQQQTDDAMRFAVEGVGNTPAILLLSTSKSPKSVRLDPGAVLDFSYVAKEGLLWIRFANLPSPRELTIQF